MTLSLAQLVERIAGLSIDRGGVRDVLDRYVAERVRALGLRRTEDFITLATDPAGSEQRRLIEAITVPHTWFYRDPEQLQIIAKLLVAAPAGPVAVWVAGCATGEEAYTIAMIGRRVGRELRVLATDVSNVALGTARRGVYSAESVRDVPDLERHWISECEDGFIVDPALRANMSFERHNLIDLPPMAPCGGGWDLVVCRNVLIYFAPNPSARVFERFARALRDGGWLVVGASEIVFKPPQGLELVPMGTRLVLRRPAGGLKMLPAPQSSSLPRRPLALPAAHASSASVRSDAGTPGEPTVKPPLQPAAVRRDDETDRQDDLAALLGQGHALFDRGEIGAAIALYAELKDRHPSVAEVWLFLGIARFAYGDMEGAADALRSCRCLSTTLWPAAFFLARASERIGRYAEAQQLYDWLALEGPQPLALISQSAVINELRALQHDFQSAARRLARERALPPPRKKR